MFDRSQVAEVDVSELARRRKLPARKIGRRWVFLSDLLPAAVLPDGRPPTHGARATTNSRIVSRARIAGSARLAAISGMGREGAKRRWARDSRDRPWVRFPGMTSDPHFGLTGLATMGANLARNVAHHDIPVAVHNRTTSRTEKFIAEHGAEGPLTGHELRRGLGRRARAPAGADDHGAGGRRDRRRDRGDPAAPRRRRHPDRRRQRELPRHPAAPRGGRAEPASTSSVSGCPAARRAR